MATYKPLNFEQMKAILQANGMNIVRFRSATHDTDVFDIVDAENSVVKGDCGLMDVEMFIEQRGLRLPSSPDFIGRQCRVASYGFGKVIDVKPNDPGFPGVWVLVDFGDGSRHEPGWFLSTMNVEFFTEGIDSMAQIDYQDQEMMEPLDLNALAQGLPEEDEPEVSEDRLERQAQAHIEALAQHRDDPLF